MDDGVGPNEVRTAAAVCRQELSNLVDLDWSVRARDLEWSCRQTLDHISNAQMFYASHLAFAAKERLPRAGEREYRLSIPELLLTVEVSAAILEHVIRATPASRRAFHSAGMADVSGFAGKFAHILGTFGLKSRPRPLVSRTGIPEVPSISCLITLAVVRESRTHLPRLSRGIMDLKPAQRNSTAAQRKSILSRSGHVAIPM